MSFLVKTELKTVTTIPLIDKLTGADATVVEEIISESISVMTGKLSKYYDTDAIFSAIGDDRHKTVLKYLKDICKYEIYERCNQSSNSAKMKRDEAMAELEKLNTGENYDRTLPKRTTTTENTATESDDIRFGGTQKFTSRY